MYASSSRTPQSSSTLPNSRKHAAPKQTAIGYPILPVQELVDCLQELGANIEEEHLRKPQGPMIRNIWSAVLLYFTGVSKAGLERPKGAMLSMTSYPELYSEPLHLQMFFFHVKRLVKTAGVETFTLQDLCRPEHARVCDCFSAVINFAKFKLSHSGLYEELVRQGDDINQRRIELADEAVRIQYQLEQLKQQIEAKKPLAGEREDRNQAIFRELGELKKQQKQLLDKVMQAEAEREARRKEWRELEKTTAALSSKIDEQRARVVRSPERVRRTIGELSAQTADHKEQLAGVTKNNRDIDTRLELITQCDQDVRRLLETLTKADKDQREIETLNAKKAGLDGNLQATDIESQSGVTRLEQLKIQYDNATDKLKRALEKWAEKKERYDVTIARLRDEYEVIKRERDVDDASMRMHDKESARIKQEIDDYLARNQIEVEALMKEYWTLRANCENYMIEMRNKLALD